jgi:cyanophycin synthetase
MGRTALTSRALDSLSLYYKAAQRVRRRSRAAVAVAAERSRFYETAWREAAARVGAEVRVVGDSVLDISRGNRRLLVRDNLTSLDDPVTLSVAGDKPLVYSLLVERRIPVPRHGVFRRDDLDGAWGFASALAKPCVVKPALDGAAGAGITTGLTQKRALAAALARAGAWSEEVVVEEQVEGDNYRLLYLDGELLDAVRRGPPLLRGDGRSTVRQLIAAENAGRAAAGTAAAQSLLAVDRDLANTLRRQSYELSSVLPDGSVVQAKTVVNDNRREDNEDATGRVCRALVETGAAAAVAVGVRLAGVDVITADPAVPLDESGGVVLEVNTTPGHYYHALRRGQGVPVAAMIVERVLGKPA